MSKEPDNTPQDDSAPAENALYFGIDLGTSRSSIASASGVRKTIESYVGWPKDAVSLKKFGGQEIIYGKQALDNRLSLDLYRPLADGVIQDDADGSRNLEAARELISYLVEMIEPGRGQQLYGVVGVPSEASGKNKEAIIESTKGILDSVMIVTEPFCVAYGMDRISDVRRRVARSRAIDARAPWKAPTAPGRRDAPHFCAVKTPAQPCPARPAPPSLCPTLASSMLGSTRHADMHRLRSAYRTARAGLQESSPERYNIEREGRERSHLPRGSMFFNHDDPFATARRHVARHVSRSCITLRHRSDASQRATL